MKRQPDIVIDTPEETTSVPKPRQKTSSFFWPIFLILLGTLLLLNNLGILPWSIWSNLWKFWPLILILFGLEMLLGKGRLTNVLITLIGLSLLLVIVTLTIPEFGQWATRILPQLNFPQLQAIFNNQAK